MGVVIPVKFCATASVLAIFAFACYVCCKESRLRKKLKQRREQNLLEKIALQEIIPEIKDPRDQQTLLLHEIQRAEDLMSDGQFERAIMHFANAIAICNDPHKMVMALKESLPVSAFDLLLKVLVDSYGKRITERNWDKRRICTFQPRRLCVSKSFS